MNRAWVDRILAISVLLCMTAIGATLLVYADLPTRWLYRYLLVYGITYLSCAIAYSSGSRLRSPNNRNTSAINTSDTELAFASSLGLKKAWGISRQHKHRPDPVRLMEEV